MRYSNNNWHVFCVTFQRFELNKMYVKMRCLIFLYMFVDAYFL